MICCIEGCGQSAVGGAALYFGCVCRACVHEMNHTKPGDVGSRILLAALPRPPSGVRAAVRKPARHAANRSPVPRARKPQIDKRAVIAALESGLTQREVAAQFGCHPTRVCQINRGAAA